ncbi:MAG: hypothetical protein HYY24_24330 [Verrucomicrobia bacterium]|nr:hypothetical protein [Verrucomicrobiota bacterium]
MSLKFFHILFIILSIVLAFGFGIWSMMQYFDGAGGALYLVLGLGSLAAGVALVFYFKYVFKKLKGVS